MPRFSDLYLGVRVENFVIALLLLIGIPILIKNNFRIKLDKSVLFLCLGIFLSLVYFLIRAAISMEDMRLMQNSFIILMIFHLVILRNFMIKNDYDIDDMIKVLLNLALIQSIIAIVMLLLPQLKEIALNLYYLGRTENIFISQMRIYGISNDYTFFTPIYHSILATITLYYALFKNKKYFVYLPFLLLIILLNGRFGLFVFAGGIVNLFFIMAYYRRIPFKIFPIMILSILFGFVISLFLKNISPYTYEWLASGIQDTINLVFYGQKTGNFEALAGSHIIFPKNWDLIFGKGFRLYGESGRIRGLSSSDIGYVNDLFMGGLVYIFILYGSVFKFLIKKRTVDFKKDETRDVQMLYMLINSQLIISLLISNYKGEVMRSGLVLIGVILIKLILLSKTKKEVE